ncbi:MAG: ROK family protein [Chloroflexi bacterium]|nr:ROK family protein [Chloroflexota bacterium]
MAAQSRFVLAMDIGGTCSRVAVADRRSLLVRRAAQPTGAKDGPERTVRRLVTVARRLARDLEGGTLAAAGVAIAGPVDPAGVVYAPPNLPGWDQFPLGRTLEERLGLPVAAGNDANMAAIAEHRFGAGRGVGDMVFVTVSTGVGGGVISGGRLLVGSKGLGGEIGHMTIDRNGPRCNCGNIGCVETLASGTAIARIARERLVKGERSLLRDRVAGGVDAVLAEHVFQAARLGDPLAKDVVETAARDLGLAFVGLIHAFNPARIVVGGGVSANWTRIAPVIKKVIARHAMPQLGGDVAIVRGALGDDAGLRGAAVLAWERAKRGSR